MTDSGATAMYFGCHDGIGCQISNLLVERNFIRGVDAPDPEIGYGIQVKLNSVGGIRDNVIVDTKGPAIMVYGATDESKANVVERNFVAGSRTSSGILIGGGPALVRNNIASSNFEGGITLQDYANRGLLRKITIVHNSTFKSSAGELLVPSHARLTDVLLANNATQAKEGHRALPSDRSGLTLRGNVDCSAAACFVDPEGRNFSPVASSPLKRVREPSDILLPADDFYGRRRGESVVAGAVGLPGPPIMLGIKSDL